MNITHISYILFKTGCSPRMNTSIFTKKCIIGAVREVLLKLTKPLAKIVRRRIFYAGFLSLLNFQPKDFIHAATSSSSLLLISCFMSYVLVWMGLPRFAKKEEALSDASWEMNSSLRDTA